GHLHDHVFLVAVHIQVCVDGRCVGLGVFVDVGQGLGDDEVGGAFHVGGGRCGRSVLMLTVAEQRSTNSFRAADSPRSTRTLGWMPRISSRSSSMSSSVLVWAEVT